ncbi:MAG: choice-of-anchor Q domain-containing protein, partial [Isosphaeraceae bacterium]
IYNDGTLTVRDAAFVRNVGASDTAHPSLSRGGGIANSPTGRLALERVTFEANNSGDGGGVDNRGTLVVSGSTFLRNTTNFIGGGGIANSGQMYVAATTFQENTGFRVGGAILNRGDMSVSDSTFLRNSIGGGPGGGGAIDHAAGTATVTRSTFRENQATFLARGGAILTDAPLTVDASTFEANRSNNGGAIYDRGQLIVTKSTFSRNRAFPGDGGALLVTGTTTLIESTVDANDCQNGGGGGLYNAGTLNVINSTVSGNSAYFRGGGIDNRGTMVVMSSTIAGNAAESGPNLSTITPAGKIEVVNSLFDGRGGANLDVGTDATFTSRGHNLFSDAPTIPLDPTDRIVADPMLGPLADNGGPTRTHALLAGSPAIDAGVAVAGLDTDQRGEPRPRGAAPDVGAFESQVEPGSLVVDTAYDYVSPSDFRTSLREAIAYAAASPGDDTVTFAENLGGLIHLSGSVELVLADPSGRITIRGDGRITIDARGESRVIRVDEGTTATLTGLTLVGGRSGSGAGISNSGSLTLDHMTIRDNGAPGADGGGIFNRGTLVISDSTIQGNAARHGGGISNMDALTVLRCQVRGNSAEMMGGGIFSGGSALIEESTIALNTAGTTGGGMSNYINSSIQIFRTTIRDNLATGGGGVFSTAGTTTISNSTISGNSAETGGGILSTGPLSVTFSTIAANQARSGAGLHDGGTSIPVPITLGNSLFANPAGGNLAIRAETPFVSRGHNLFSDAPTVALDPTDLIDTDPRLAPLGDYGGPTPTHALVEGSPAIDAGGPAEAGATDQRGAPRARGAAPDIGAFEVDPNAPAVEHPGLVVTTLDDVDNPYDRRIGLREAIRNAGMLAGDAEVTVDPALSGRLVL